MVMVIARFHRFSPAGALELSWRKSGTDDGEFSLVHNLDVDSNDRIYVCDRENDRVQIFDYDGNFIESWTDAISPGGVHCDRNNLVYVAEQGPPRRSKPNGVSIFLRNQVNLCRDLEEILKIGQLTHTVYVLIRKEIYISLNSSHIIKTITGFQDLPKFDYKASLMVKI